MMIKILNELFFRDLNKLKSEIEQYKDEAHLWLVDGEVPNSAGNLALHLIGNLRHFIGAVLGDSGYGRERELEFSLTGLPRTKLLQMLDETMTDVAAGLDKVTPEQLGVAYPIVVFADRAEPMTTAWFLIHLVTHLNYHLGQINYHRRIFDAE